MLEEQKNWKLPRKITFVFLKAQSTQYRTIIELTTAGLWDGVPKLRFFKHLYDAVFWEGSIKDLNSIDVCVMVVQTLNPSWSLEVHYYKYCWNTKQVKEDERYKDSISQKQYIWFSATHLFVQYNTPIHNQEFPLRYLH